MRTGTARAGFSLTEILMAVGILGIGMTMVASVFPVAVDQSRRSTDMTMAALSARSVAAVLRARRQRATPWLRTETMIQPAGGSGTPSPHTAKLGTTVLPYELRNYNPANFVYGDSVKEPPGAGTVGTPKVPRQYSSSRTGMYGLWSMGAYVPVVFATPMSDNPNNVGHGPWRITIMVFKSRGALPGYLNLSSSNLTNWVWEKNPGEVGGYVMDWRIDAANPQGEPNNRGEAYKVQRHLTVGNAERVVPAVAFIDKRVGGMQFYAFTAGRDQAERDAGVPCYPVSNSVPTEWVSLPGAVAAYHTILGD
jgi:prepilin-type N-terminal cleavage/methylation domain-containing protein